MTLAAVLAVAIFGMMLIGVPIGFAILAGSVIAILIIMLART